MEGTMREPWEMQRLTMSTVLPGQRDQLVGRIQERYGIAKDAATKQADEWWTKLDNAADKAATQK